MANIMDRSSKGHFSATAINDDGSGAKDINLGPDGEQSLREAGSFRYSNGEVTVGRDNIVVNAPTQGGLPGTMATVRTKTGTPISDMSQVTEDSLVDMMGTTMNIKTALRIGAIVKDGNGNYYNPQEGAPGSKQAEQFNADQKAAEVNNETIEVNLKGENCSKQLTGLKQRASGVDSHVSRIFSAVVEGKDATSEVDGLARAASATPESVTGVMNELLGNMMEGIAQYAEARHGIKIDADEFTNTVFEKWSPTRIKSALMSAYHNDLRGLDSHIDFYLSGDRSPHAKKRS